MLTKEKFLEDLSRDLKVYLSRPDEEWKAEINDECTELNIICIYESKTAAGTRIIQCFCSVGEDFLEDGRQQERETKYIQPAINSVRKALYGYKADEIEEQFKCGH